jgi:hypothetical protein
MTSLPSRPNSARSMRAETETEVVSGASFDSDSTIPLPLRRVARTPHDDGAKPNAKEPAMIAICGIGPIRAHWLEPDKPARRQM